MNKDDQRVSIVIACYNQGHYLRDAIESALVFPSPLVEVVVVDDGSTDNTQEISRSYPLIKYIYQCNQGVAAARNAGLAASTGDFIAFLDADDRFLPNAIEAGLGCFRKYPDSGFVFGRYQNIDANGSVISEPNHISDESDFYIAMLQRNLIGMQSTVLYSKHLLERLGGFEEQLRFCEDYDLYLRIARDFPVKTHDQVIAEYRKHAENISKNYRTMLETTVHVLKRQISDVKADQRYNEAVATGISNWKVHYGRLMLYDFQNHIVRHGLGPGLFRRFRNLAACYPQGIIPLTKSTLRNMIHV